MHQHDHEHQHHNNGVSNLVSRINVGIGNAVGGRKHAGRVGRATRGVRVVSNAVAVGTGIAAVAALGTTIASGGLAAPIWFIVLGGVAIVANFTGVIIGSGANHLKITQYYDLMISTHAELCSLQKKMGYDQDVLPHGITEYWYNHRRLFNMTMRRRGQEIVGVAGTAMSAAMMFSALGLLPIAPGASIGLFFASRGVSSATTAGGIFNNKDRLSIYKEIIFGYGIRFYNHTFLAEKNKATLADSILEEVLKKLNINKDIENILDKNQWRTFLVKHAVYKMLFLQSERLTTEDGLSFLNPDNKEQVVKVLSDELAKMVKKSAQGNYFGRTALRSQRDKSLVDLVPYISIDLESKLMENIVDARLMIRAKKVARSVIHNLQIDLEKNELHNSLPFYITKAALLMLSRDNNGDKVTRKISQKIRPFLKATDDKKELEESKILERFPIQGHAHGKQSIIHFHLSELCNLLAQQSERTKFRDDVLIERAQRRSIVRE